MIKLFASRVSRCSEEGGLAATTGVHRISLFESPMLKGSMGERADAQASSVRNGWAAKTSKG